VAKLHVRLDLHSLLPRFVLVESAKAAEPHPCRASLRGRQSRRDRHL
jgi:hypothetical protein